MRTPSQPARRALLVFALLLAGLALLALADWWVALPATATAHYVGRDSCAQCHTVQHQQWVGSHHDRAMELASDTSIVGDFNDTQFTRFGVTTKFFRRDGHYFVNTEGPDGTFQDFQVKYTFGVEPLQQYMVEFPDGRVQVLRVSWDTVKNEWFYVTPPDVLDERIEPGDPLHWTGIGQNWNTMCADCHSTDLHKNFDLASNTYHTTFSEIDVSCEACHGPASLHVQIAESRSLFWDRHHGYGLVNTMQGAPASRQIDTCAPCHSRRSHIHADYRPGNAYLDHFDPSLLDEGLYHVDGQILDEVYVYGSFLQSKMHVEGVRCTDCHNPHTTKLKFEGNRLCAQCHQPGKYDSPTHHHHTDLAATQCVNCHMVEKNYMVVDGRRDHSFRIPRPDLSASLGTPNACNQCHTRPEETSAWAAQAIQAWVGDKPRDTAPHYGQVLAAARQGEPEGLVLLQDLLRQRKLPDIVRATAVGLLSTYPDEAAARLARESMDHASPLVRAAGIRSLSLDFLRSFPQQVAARLQDPIRLVRLAAARRLVGEAARLIEVQYQSALDLAVTEYESAQQVMEERASAQLNLAAVNQALGKTDATIESLRRAMRLEPYLSGVRDKLAQILENQGGDADEVRSLRVEEAALLQRNYQLFPKSGPLRYQRGMLLYLLGDYPGAQEALQAACQLEPDNYQHWLALALICEKQQQWSGAAQAMQQMHRLRPNDPAVMGIYRRIQQARQADGSK